MATKPNHPFKVKGCEFKGGDSYKMVISKGFKSDGTRNKITKTVRATSSKDLELLYAQFLTEVETGLFVNTSNIKFKDFIEHHWMVDNEVKNLAPKTFSRYKELLDKRILPALGELRLQKISRPHLVQFFNNLEEDGIRLDGKEGKLSGKTILHYYRLLSKIFNNAMNWDLIPINPMSKIKPLKVTRKEAIAYDDDQTITLFDALNGEPFKYSVMVNMAVFTGLRRGELMGLEWRDIDFDKATLNVQQASQYVPGKGVFTKDPKTESSKRLISIPEYIVTLLKKYKAWQNEERLKAGDLWKDNGRLFTQWNGEPMHPDTISQWFPKFIRRHKLPHITFHGLRHTNASLLIAEGLDIKTISSRLGHAQTSTLLNIYSHRLRKPDRTAADSLEKLLIKDNSTQIQDQNN